MDVLPLSSFDGFRPPGYRRTRRNGSPPFYFKERISFSCSNVIQPFKTALSNPSLVIFPVKYIRFNVLYILITLLTDLLLTCQQYPGYPGLSSGYLVWTYLLYILLLSRLWSLHLPIRKKPHNP